MKTIPRLCFAHLPTPVESLSRLTAMLKGPNIWIKRDDQTGLAFGGNKTRKLEYLLADAQAHGAKTLITSGAIQSNHCRQTAACAARFGFDCILILSMDKRQDPPENEEINGNLLLDYLFGAKIVYTSKENRFKVIDDVFQEAWKMGKRPYLIPYGASNPVGATAYVFAFRELLEQKVKPDWIVCASSSGGTQAGLVLGSLLFDKSVKILGISVDEPANVIQKRIYDLVIETADWMSEKVHINPEQILVNDEFLGGGYGVLSELEQNAIRIFARQEGILLDPVYTGRSAGAMMTMVKRNFFAKNENILFWHTGGTPALFAKNYYTKILSDTKTL